LFFQSDYILRMIQMMGDFFRRLAEIVDENEKADEFDELMRKHCAVDLKTVDALSVDSLIALLPDNPRFVLSELLYLRAYAFQLHDEDRDEFLYKSFRLLLSVAHENLLCELRRDRMMDFYESINEKMSSQDLICVFQFLLLADDYDTAEDILFDAIESAPSCDLKPIVQAGIEGFQRVSTFTNRELVLGGLSVEEVTDILTELNALLSDEA